MATTTLTAVVLMLGLIAAVNLVLTLTLVHRIRGYNRVHTVVEPRHLRLAPGTPVPPFRATAIDGVGRSSADLMGSASVIAFFAESCDACRTQVPAFVDFAERFGGDRTHVLAVINGARERAEAFAEHLRAVATIIVEPERGGLARDFAVRAYPTFYLLDDHARVQGGGPTIQHVVAEAGVKW